jgi:hypothetical protein
VERITRLCPDLVTVKVLMDDLNFRELEILNMVEEVGDKGWLYVLL